MLPLSAGPLSELDFHQAVVRYYRMSHPTARNPSAGSAEPYWFEWKTGLLYLIELFDLDSDIEAVGFQLRGTKGWDDIGLRFRNGTIRLVQTKHSRANDHLTFGDLVVAEPESKSRGDDR